MICWPVQCIQETQLKQDYKILKQKRIHFENTPHRIPNLYPCTTSLIHPSMSTSGLGRHHIEMPIENFFF